MHISTRLSTTVGCILLGAILAGCQSAEPIRDDTEVAAEMPARAFFVQVGMSDTRSEAESTWQEAASWWEQLGTPPEPLRRYDDPPVRVVWQTPYYRVRVGPVATRDEADAVRDALSRRFEQAFIARGAPDDGM